MKIYIKNMVCQRCISAVEGIFGELKIPVQEIQLGEVQTDIAMQPFSLKQLDQKLAALGFERIDNRKARLIEKIKNTIINLVHYREEPLQINLSEHLSKTLCHDYSYLSKLFSETEGITIEKYFIAQKIEKVKELLRYDELTLSEIAYKMGYSSVAYLSGQFKKQTGLTPTFFKNRKAVMRKKIEEI